MAQVTTVRQIKTHEPLMGLHDSLVDLQICRASTQALDIDTPFLRVQMEGFQSTGLACQLNLVNMLVSTVVSSSWITFGVFVGHWRSESIKNSSGSDIF